jgi:hypothetical protein
MGAKRTRDEDDAEEAFPRGASGAGGDDLPRGGGGSTGGSTAASKKRSKNRMFDDDDDGGVRAHRSHHSHLWHPRDVTTKLVVIPRRPGAPADRRGTRRRRRIAPSLFLIHANRAD